MVAASAKAATKPKAGCRCDIIRAAMKIASVRHQHQRRQRLDAPQLGRARGVAGGVEGEGAGRGHGELSKQ